MYLMTSGRSVSFVFWRLNTRQYSQLHQFVCRSLAPSWLRANEETRRMALTNLAVYTSLCDRVKAYGGFVDSLLKRLRGMCLICVMMSLY